MNVTVAESGAILEYLCDELGPTHLLPSKSTHLETHLLYKQWLYWQVSAQGPMLGQSMYTCTSRASRSRRASAMTSPRNASTRKDSVRQRCLQMIDDQLRAAGGPFMFGGEVSVVDVACFAYAASAFWAGVDVSGMKGLGKWLEMLHERPAFKVGLGIPFEMPAFFGPPWG